MKQIFTIITAFIFAVITNAQEQTSKEMFLEAESYFLYEDFTEALPLYLKLSKENPANDNLNYKIGVCYLNIPYEKERAVDFLEKAVKNINPNYKAGSQKEVQAPLDALFYLGNAYRINNQLEKAQKTYFDFKRQINQEVYDEELVSEQLRTLERAKKYISKPIFFKFTNLGDPINSKFEERNAVVSADEKTMVYNVKLQFYDALFYSTLANGKWSAPINIIPDLGVDGDVYSTGLSADGKELYIYRSDNYDGNLYVSKFTGSRWTPIKRLNENINTKYWESHASVSADGTTLYFTSNRKGGFGGLDVYKATRKDLSRDDWGNVTNLGDAINSQFNEESPFISEDGQVLYFSSYGHFNMGGYDIFYSTLLGEDKWSAPLNMGYPLNTTDDDVFYVPVGNGSFAYVCRYYSENIGKLDVYKVEVFSDQHPRKFHLKGLLTIPNESLNSQIIAKLVNRKTKDTISRIIVDPTKSSFETELKAGDYKLIIEGKDVQKTIEEFKIDGTQINDEVIVNSKLKAIPRTEKPISQNNPAIGIINFTKSFFKVKDNSPIALSFATPNGSQVILTILTDSLPPKKDVFKTVTDSAKYLYTPLKGKNLLKFKAVAPNKDILEGEIVIYYEPQADTSINTELAQEIEDKQRELLYDKALLAVMAQGSLQQTIIATDVLKENLNTLNELSDFLKNKAQYGDFKPSEVDSLLKAYSQQQPSNTQLLIDALTYSKTADLASIIDSLNKSNSKNNVADAVKFLNNKLNDDDARTRSLLSLTSRLADAGNVYYYLFGLKKASQGKLKLVVDTISLSNNKLYTPEDLLNYLTEKAIRNGYTENDVLLAFAAIPAFTASPALLLSTISGLANGKIAKLLNEYHLNEKQITNTSLLISDLIEKARQNTIAPSEIIKLILKANSAFNFNQLHNDLKMLSVGKLKMLLDSIDIENERLTSTSELLNYILSKRNNNGIEKELLKTMTFIASKNLVKAGAAKVLVQTGIRFSIITRGLIAIFSVLIILIFIIAIRRGKQ